MKRTISRPRPKTGSPDRRPTGQGAAAFLTRLQTELATPNQGDFLPVADEQFIKCSSAIHKAVQSSFTGDRQRALPLPSELLPPL
jgi:hypothetical protein